MKHGGAIPTAIVSLYLLHLPMGCAPTMGDFYRWRHCNRARQLTEKGIHQIMHGWQWNKECPLDVLVQDRSIVIVYWNGDRVLNHRYEVISFATWIGFIVRTWWHLQSYSLFATSNPAVTYHDVINSVVTVLWFVYGETCNDFTCWESQFSPEYESFNGISVNFAPTPITDNQKVNVTEGV